MVVLGADVHRRTHAFVAVDEIGWARERFGTELRWAIEDCRHSSARREPDLPVASHDAVSRELKLLTDQRRISRLVALAAPSLLAMPGVGALTAAKIVGEAAGVWSGNTAGRVRLTRSGSRQLNAATTI